MYWICEEEQIGGWQVKKPVQQEVLAVFKVVIDKRATVSTGFILSR